MEEEDKKRVIEKWVTLRVLFVWLIALAAGIMMGATLMGYGKFGTMRYKPVDKIGNWMYVQRWYNTQHTYKVDKQILHVDRNCPNMMHDRGVVRWKSDSVDWWMMESMCSKCVTDEHASAIIDRLRYKEDNYKLEVYE